MGSACRSRRRETSGIPLNRAPDGGAVGSERVSFESRSGPTVGRESALEQFDATLDALEAGKSACIALDGEPGIGKTHLLTELHRRAEERGHLVLGGSATEFERDLPFGVWADALDAYVASQELELGESWSTDNARELDDILPSLRRAAAAGVAPFPTSGTAPTGPPERCSSSSRGNARWSSCSTTSTGATRHRSSCWPPSCDAARRRRSSSRSPSGAHTPLRPLRSAGDPRGAPDLPRAARRGRGERAARRSRAANRRSHLPSRRRQPLLLQQPGARGRGGGWTRRWTRAAAPSPWVGCPCRPRSRRPRRGARLLAGRGAHAAAGRGRCRGAVRAGSRGRGRRLPPSDSSTPRRPARPRSHSSDVGASTVRLSSPPCAIRGLRVDARRLEARSTRARGRRAGAAGRSRGRARPPRRAVRRAGRRGGDRSDAGGRNGCAQSAPAAAARWYESALRLLPADDDARSTCALRLHRRCVPSASSTAAAHAARGARAPPEDAVARSVELTAHCAAVEHWLGRHEEAHRRLSRAWEELPDRVTVEAAALRSSSPWTGSTSSTSRRRSRWARRAGDRARGRRPRAHRRGRRRPLSCGDGGRACRDADRAPREARAEVDAPVRRRARPTPGGALSPRLGRDLPRALRRRGRPRRARHRDRAGLRRGPAARTAVARQELPLRDAGAPRDAIELCESALEAARLSASPHELYRALFELGWTLYYAGDLDGAIAAHEESSRVDPRLAGATIPNGGGGPGWGLGVAWLEAGDVERGRELLLELGGRETSRARCPSSAASTGRASRSPRSPSATCDAADGYARRAEDDAAQLPLQLPSALAGRARAAVLLAGGEPLEAARVAARLGRGRRLGRSAASGRVLARPRGPRARSRRRAEPRRCSPPRGGAGARRVRLGARAGRDAARAAAARRPRRATRPGRVRRAAASTR